MTNQERHMDQGEDFTWQGNLLTRVVTGVSVLIWRWNGDQVGLRPFLGRFTSHVALGILLALLVFFGGSGLDALLIVSRTVALGQEQTQATRTTEASARPYYRVAFQARVPRRAEPETAIPERPRLEITTYVVQAGDTTEKIAETFGLQPTTIMWSNPELEKSPDLLRIGQVLTILPVDGVYHTVEAEDTLESLAEKYKVTVDDILNCSYNHFPASGVVHPGDKVIVPDGTKPYEKREVTAYEGPVPEAVEASGAFRWPAFGYVSQGYWYGHRAIDVADEVGAAVMATDAGYVSFAGWTDLGYGYLVVIDHANGYQTYYAHLSNIFVFEGETVEAGQVIAAMGSSGNSTGPHLHFEIRYDGYPTNPLIYLP